MALAGYLVLNNVRAAYVEIHTGVLLCTPRLRKTTPQSTHPLRKQQTLQPGLCTCGSPTYTDESSGRLSSASTASSSDTSDDAPSLRLQSKACCSSRADSNATGDYSDEEPVREDEPRGRERVVQLSGYVVEVVDAESDAYRGDASLYPFAFQVNTFAPVTRDAAGNRTGGGERVDSLTLAAVDARSKTLWVKRIRHWHRFGWRETEFVHAADNDFFYLQTMMLSRETRRRSIVEYPRESYQRLSLASESVSVSASGSGRPSRRRFYRAPAGAIGVHVLVPPS